MHPRVKKLIVLCAIAATLLGTILFFKMKSGTSGINVALYQNQALLVTVPELKTINGGLYVDDPYKQQEEEAAKAKKKEEESKEGDLDKEEEKDTEKDSTSNKKEDKKSETEKRREEEAKKFEEDLAKENEEIDLDKPELTASNDNKPKISIIITNLGLSKSTTLKALELPNSITLGFSPYASNISEWLDHASYKKYVSLLNLPMQPLNYPIDDPGPVALLHNLTPKENLQRLRKVLMKSKKTIGLYTTPNEVFTSTIEDMKPVLAELKKYSRVFLYGDFKNDAILRKSAKQISLMYNNINVVIDRVLTPDAISSRLHKLEKIAKTNGSAVGMMGAYPINIKVLENWIKTLDEKNISLVPISQIYISSKNKSKEVKKKTPVVKSPALPNNQTSASPAKTLKHDKKL